MCLELAIEWAATSPWNTPWQWPFDPGVFMYETWLATSLQRENQGDILTGSFISFTGCFRHHQFNCCIPFCGPRKLVWGGQKQSPTYQLICCFGGMRVCVCVCYFWMMIKILGGHLGKNMDPLKRELLIAIIYDLYPVTIWLVMKPCWGPNRHQATHTRKWLTHFSSRSALAKFFSLMEAHGRYLKLPSI